MSSIHHPIVGVLESIWFSIFTVSSLIWGNILLIAWAILATIGVFFAINFHVYMVMAAGTTWGWWEENFYEDIMAWIYSEIYVNWFLYELIIPT